mgnify:CR=1 FL=1
MNKKLGRVAAIALSAAMITSAFAMSTATAFAAPTPESATAALKTNTVYMQLGGNTQVKEAKADLIQDESAGIQDESAGTLTDNQLQIASVTAADGTEVTGGTVGTTADTTISADNTYVKADTTADGNDFTFDEVKAGDQKVTVSNLTYTKGTTIYNLAPITFNVDLVDPATAGGYVGSVWSTANGTTTTAGAATTVEDDTITTSANIGDTVYLYSKAVSADDTATAFAAPVYKAAIKNVVSSNTDAFTFPSDTSNTATAVGAGSGVATYAYTYTGNATGITKVSPTLTVKAAYSGVTAITPTGSKYTVACTSGSVVMTNSELANATLVLGDDVTVPAGATVGTIDPNGHTVTVNGGTVKSIASTVASSNVVVESTDTDATASDVSAIDVTGTVKIGNTGDTVTTKVGTVKADGLVTVDANNNADKTAIGSTVSSITADNVTVNSKKASIGAITKKATAGTVTVTAGADGVSLPALDGYTLAVEDNATVASVANGTAVITDGKTLTVSGKAAFTGDVTSSTSTGSAGSAGILKVASGNLTVKGTAADKFTLQLTSVTAGATAFTTTATTATQDYTNDGTNAGSTAFANIVTNGYTAVRAAGATNAVIDKTIGIAGLKDATTGTTLDGSAYDLPVISGEVKALAVNPYPAASLGNYTVNWSYCNAAGTTANLTQKNSNFKLGVTGDTENLTNTISGTYEANNTTLNTQYVKATLQDKTGTPVTGASIIYKVTVSATKAVDTTDFSLTADQPVIAPTKSMTLTAVANGSNPLSSTTDGTSVTAKSSNTAVAVVDPTATADGNNATMNVTATGVGTTTITVTYNKKDGSTVSHEYNVVVSDTPVVAYVDGKAVNPNDTLSFTQSTTKKITFVSVGGAKIDTFNYNAGNGKIMSTRAYADSKWNGVSGEYGMYMNGPVGSATGVYVNGQKICSVKVADRPFTCDTTYNFNLKAGKTYEFKLTPAAGTTFDNFTFNTAKDAALSTNGYKKNADGTINAFVKAVQKGTYGVYVTINGVQYKVFAVTVD